MRCISESRLQLSGDLKSLTPPHQEIKCIINCEREPVRTRSPTFVFVLWNLSAVIQCHEVRSLSIFFYFILSLHNIYSALSLLLAWQIACCIRARGTHFKINIFHLISQYFLIIRKMLNIRSVGRQCTLHTCIREHVTFTITGTFTQVLLVQLTFTPKSYFNRISLLLHINITFGNYQLNFTFALLTSWLE